MKKLFFLFLLICLIMPLSTGYSNNYQDLKNSDFFRFFNIKEIKRKQINNTDYQIIFKTGGFKEFIDIDITFTSEEKIKSATLTVSRQWIGNYENRINPFAKDIVKSFIFELTPGPDKLIVMDLVNGIFNVTGKKDRVLYTQGRERPQVVTTDGLKVFLGILNKTELKHPECNIFVENKLLDGISKFIVIISRK